MKRRDWLCPNIRDRLPGRRLPPILPRLILLLRWAGSDRQGASRVHPRSRGEQCCPVRGQHPRGDIQHLLFPGGCGGEGEAHLPAPRAAARFSAERCLPGGGRSCVGPDTNLPLQEAALLPGAAQLGGDGEAGAKPPEINR